MIYSGDAEIRRKSVTTIGQNFAIPTPSYSANSQQFMSTHQQQQQQQHHQYQQYNPHGSLMMPDSGIEPHPENTIYGDMTLLNGNPLYRQQQNPQLGYGKPSQPNFASMSYINSPQKMSTPITLRTKEQFVSGAQPHQPFGQFRANTQAPSYQMPPPTTIGDAQQQQQFNAAQSIQNYMKNFKKLLS